MYCDFSTHISHGVSIDSFRHSLHASLIDYFYSLLTIYEG